MRLHLALTLGATACLLLIWGGAGDGHVALAEPADAGTAMDVSAETCADCHAEQVEGVPLGPHYVLDEDPELAAHYGVGASCVACHGDPTKHLETADPADIFNYGPETTAQARSANCLECHSESHPRFFASRHAVHGLDCTSCHGIHANDGRSSALLKVVEGAELVEADAVSASCFQCHDNVFTEFAFNERHRLREGILSCADCHNPHEPQARMMLGGFKQEACLGCHADKGGPFVFEHGSQRVEGCMSCHAPHGSPNRHMLSFQSVADLCYSCHAVVPGFHTRFTNETQCTNCHSTIHGSNFDAAFLQ